MTRSIVTVKGLGSVFSQAFKASRGEIFLGTLSVSEKSIVFSDPTGSIVCEFISFDLAWMTGTIILETWNWVPTTVGNYLEVSAVRFALPSLRQELCSYQLTSKEWVISC